MTDQTTAQPLTDRQLDQIEARVNARRAALSGWINCYSPLSEQEALENAETALKEDVPALIAEIRRLRAAMEKIRHLHKDSPMGPCPICIDADRLAAGGDGLVPYPCPTGRLAGAQDCDPPHVRAARYADAGNEMAASLVRDGFGDDEITEILNRPAAVVVAGDSGTGQ